LGFGDTTITYLLVIIRNELFSEAKKTIDNNLNTFFLFIKVGRSEISLKPYNSRTTKAFLVNNTNKFSFKKWLQDELKISRS
jgi:hypothetical protein